MTEIFGLNDVLCGRGGATNKHIGNKKFRSLVAEHQSRYLSAKKTEKASIAREIVSMIQNNGGRFLKKNDKTDQWEEVTLKKAAEKASQALREGLDVRHKVVRPKGQKREKENEEEISNKAKVATTGKVISTSPAIVSVTGEINKIEELPSAATAAAAAATTKDPRLIYQPPKEISQEDCTGFCAI